MKDNELKEWENTERSVSLTNEQWNLLTTYILMSTNYRRGEREAWERLSTEKDADGNPVFQNAAGNAEFYARLEVELEKIRNKIDHPYLS